MRLTKTLLLTLATLACTGPLCAQDLHNTLFYMNPLHMNPAFAGAFEGTYRIGGIYRDQARSVVKHAYSTPSIYVDAPILMIGKRHWIGVGFLAFKDQSGTGKLKTTAGQLTGAFHLALDKKSQNVLTLGVQYGKVGRSIGDFKAFRLQDQIEEHQLTNADYNTITSEDEQNYGSKAKGDYTDINTGLLLKSKLNKKTNFNAGFSVRHLTKPDVDFKPSTNKFERRFITHTQLDAALQGKWSIMPELYFTNLTPANQFQIHGWAGYNLNPAKKIKLNFGLGYRVKDSAQFLVGINYGDIQAALAYDLTVSSLADANKRQGGFEIGVNYIGKIYKKPPLKPVILCPHL